MIEPSAFSFHCNDKARVYSRLRIGLYQENFFKKIGFWLAQTISLD